MWAVTHEFDGPVKLTGASVVAFWVPHAKVPHGAGGQAHPYLTDVVALQVDEELGLTFDAAVVLGASVAAFGAGRQPLGAHCGKNTKRGRLRSGTADHHNCFPARREF